MKEIIIVIFTTLDIIPPAPAPLQPTFQMQEPWLVTALATVNVDTTNVIQTISPQYWDPIYRFQMIYFKFVTTQERSIL